VWIAVLVGRLVMAAMNAGPTRWSPLQRCRSYPGKNAPHPGIAFEASMREETMIANADRKGSAEIEAK